MNSARFIAFALCFFVAAVVSCKKKASSSATPTPTDAVASDTSPAPPQTAPIRGPGPMPPAAVGPAVVSNEGGADAVLSQLSVELRKYVVRTRSVPKTYEEFITKSNVQAPPPPAGKKYAIENQAIVLVRR